MTSETNFKFIYLLRQFSVFELGLCYVELSGIEIEVDKEFFFMDI